MSVRSEADIPTELVLRLDRLESLIQHQTTVISALSNRLLSIAEKDKNCLPPLNSGAPENVRGTSVSHTSPMYSSLAGDVSTSIDSRMRYQYNDDPLLIPLGHQTPTGSLLGLERIRSLIGDYSQDFFLFLESERSLQPLVPRVPYSSILEELNARRESTDFLVSSFHTHIHSQFPIIEHESFHEMFETFLRTSEGKSSSDALCLIILALGEICSNTIEVYDTESQSDGNGSEYFAHAHRLLTTEGLTLFSRDIRVPMAYFLSSIYFRYRGRPLEAWKMIHTASTGVQLMFS